MGSEDSNMRQTILGARPGWRLGMLTAVLVASTGALGGCFHHHHHRPKSPDVHVRKGGPPPHAPAHGYRHKHGDGIELVYDSEIGVYVVVGHSAHYHDGRHYFRWVDGEWMMSLQMDHGWIVASSRDVPPRLAAHHGKKHKKAKKRGHGGGHPAKHDQR
jgi:hypothetical protein